jgi:hydroxyethylthiazole kinase-like uncharacterized protein yjeF
LRVGAGLVSVAGHPQTVSMMNANCPEIMCHPIQSAAELTPLIEKADVIVVGPGLGQTAWSKELWQVVMEQSLPLVVDADALNLLSQQNINKENWVLTPHPGEASRLLNLSAQEIQADRMQAIKALNKKYGGVCILKGAGSLIYAPNSLPALCDKGNPGLASAGMGDILSGVLGGLIAQGIPIGEAAKMAVCMHAMAGDLAAKDGERGMIAMDLMPFLRRLSNNSTQS